MAFMPIKTPLIDSARPGYAGSLGPKDDLVPNAKVPNAKSLPKEQICKFEALLTPSDKPVTVSSPPREGSPRTQEPSTPDRSAPSPGEAAQKTVGQKTVDRPKTEAPERAPEVGPEVGKEAATPAAKPADGADSPPASPDKGSRAPKEGATRTDEAAPRSEKFSDSSAPSSAPTASLAAMMSLLPPPETEVSEIQPAEGELAEPETPGAMDAPAAGSVRFFQPAADRPAADRPPIPEASADPIGLPASSEAAPPAAENLPPEPSPAPSQARELESPPASRTAPAPEEDGPTPGTETALLKSEAPHRDAGKPDAPPAATDPQKPEAEKPEAVKIATEKPEPQKPEAVKIATEKPEGAPPAPPPNGSTPDGTAARPGGQTPTTPGSATLAASLETAAKATPPTSGAAASQEPAAAAPVAEPLAAKQEGDAKDESKDRRDPSDLARNRENRARAGERLAAKLADNHAALVRDEIALSGPAGSGPAGRFKSLILAAAFEKSSGADEGRAPPSAVNAGGGGSQSPMAIPGTAPASEVSGAAPTVKSARGGAPPTPHAPIFQQVGARLVETAENGGGRVVMELRPEHLGRMTIDVDVRDDGRVQATILVDRPEVLEQLRRDAGQLEEALRNSGLNADPNSLQFALREQTQDRNRAKRDGRNPRETDPLEPLERQAAPGGSQQSVVPGLGVIDLRI